MYDEIHKPLSGVRSQEMAAGPGNDFEFVNIPPQQPHIVPLPRRFEDSLLLLKEQWNDEKYEIDSIFDEERAELVRDHETDLAELASRRKESLLVRQRELEILIDNMVAYRRRPLRPLPTEPEAAGGIIMRLTAMLWSRGNG